MNLFLILKHTKNIKLTYLAIVENFNLASFMTYGIVSMWIHVKIFT